MLGLRRGAFTCVEWQVALCDPIWQVTLRSSEMGSREELYSPFNPSTFNIVILFSNTNNQYYIRPESLI